MRKIHLSSSEIQDLINKYRSELKKLQFQIDEVELTIAELEGLLDNVEEREKHALNRLTLKQKKLSAPSSPRRRGRPRKSDIIDKTEDTTDSKTNIESKQKGYKLSSWDEKVIESLQSSGKTLITQEITGFVKRKFQENGEQVSDEVIRNKIVRSLQKLANRRNDLAKVKYKGKGFAYALPEWLNKRGTLQKEYKR